MIDRSLHVDLHISELLHELLDTGKPVMLSKDGVGEYFGNLGSTARNACTLEGCLEALTGRVRVKTCLRQDCISRGQPKPLWLFGADKDSADGHAAVCKSCEAKRIGAIGKRKKAKEADSASS